MRTGQRQSNQQTKASAHSLNSDRLIVGRGFSVEIKERIDAAKKHLWVVQLTLFDKKYNWVFFTKANAKRFKQILLKRFHN